MPRAPWRCTPWQARAATAAPGWPGTPRASPPKSAQWLFGAGVYLARQADLPLPELSSPDAAEQLWQTLTVAGDPTYLPQQADPLRLQCPPAPVAAGSKPAAPQYYTGRITYYSAFKHLGYLKRDDGDEKGTFFHYNQVNDPLLRQLLELGQGVDQEVRCRLGMRSTPHRPAGSGRRRVPAEGKCGAA